MADYLRQPNEYSVVFAIAQADSEEIKRIDTGLVAVWLVNELVIPVAADQVQDVLRIVVQTVRREVLS